ncbi:MAG: hypothetical protein O7G85_17410 [Planctomycetota bacterium]|nr:hypothetical protein [Planctomycetota bacterium]
MRIDHFAYQRATRVASFGLLLQIVIGLILLIFGLILKDTTLKFGAMYTLLGVIVWLALMVIFYQHKLEKLESLEEDELASSRGEGVRSMFAEDNDEMRVAARRLGMMYKWLMPIISLGLAMMLGLFAWYMLSFMQARNLPDSDLATDFLTTANRGWGISLCLGASVAAFIFSRFIAGMSRQPAWQNLRGGAAFMVGTSLLCLLIAIGIGFRFFENESVMIGIGYAIPIFMIVLAIEIVLNFILNLYRPRIPGETPRPAFDSKMLSLMAAPDNLVRSINEAVNYQFGFDVTSTWGYQLLLRNFVWLIAIGFVAMVLLNTMVIVEPHQQAVKLRGGAIVDDKVHEAGILWKLPWPIETAEVHDVRRIRTLPLTAQRTVFHRPLRDNPNGDDRELDLWKDALKGKTDEEVIPFIVGASSLDIQDEFLEEIQAFETDEVEVLSDEIGISYSLVQCEIALEYRIKDDGGLREYLKFAPDTVKRRNRLNERELTLKSLALAVVNDELASRSLDDALALGQESLPLEIKRRIQASFDKHEAGIEVVAVNFPTMRPMDSSYNAFIDLSLASQERRQRLSEVRMEVVYSRIIQVGDESMLTPVLEGIDEWDRLRIEKGLDDPETVAQRMKVEQFLLDGGGENAQNIAYAENERWVKVLQARTRASRTLGQIPAYRAAPRLYRQREIMRVLSQKLQFARKYVVGIDPKDFQINVELKQLNSMLNFEDAMLEEGEVPDE